MIISRLLLFLPLHQHLMIVVKCFLKSMLSCYMTIFFLCIVLLLYG